MATGASWERLKASPAYGMIPMMTLRRLSAPLKSTSSASTEAKFVVAPLSVGVPVISTAAPAPGGRAPKLQRTIPASTEHPPTVPVMEVTMNPAGSTSSRRTLLALIGPWLVTVSRKVSGCSTSTEAEEDSSVRATSTTGRTGVTEVAALFELTRSRRPPATKALLVSRPMPPASTVNVPTAAPPAGRLPRPQRITPASFVQAPPGIVIESRPDPKGRTLVKSTAVASDGPRLVTVTV